MKKIKILASVAAMSLVAFGCIKRQETSNEDPAENGSASVRGVVIGDFDQVIDTTTRHRPYPGSIGLEYAPEGTTVAVKYRTSDLSLNGASGANANEWNLVSARVGANGAYTASLPANGKNVNAQVSVAPFNFDQAVIRYDEIESTYEKYKLTVTDAQALNGACFLLPMNYLDGVIAFWIDATGTTVEPTAAANADISFRIDLYDQFGGNSVTKDAAAAYIAQYISNAYGLYYSYSSGAEIFVEMDEPGNFPDATLPVANGLSLVVLEQGITGGLEVPVYTTTRAVFWRESETLQLINGESRVHDIILDYDNDGMWGPF
jgi:hypothetical protein